MKLFIYEHCPFCCRALMIIGLKQLDVPVEIIMEGDVDTPTRMVGRKVVPILQKPDGSYMPESMDIVHYLDQAPTPTIVRRDGDTALNNWVERAWKIGMKLCVPRFTQADFRELATPQAREAFIAREVRAYGDLEVLRQQTGELLAELQPLLDELELLLATPAPHISETDFRLFPLLRSLSIVKEIRLGTNAQRYADDMALRSRIPLFTDMAR